MAAAIGVVLATDGSVRHSEIRGLSTATDPADRERTLAAARSAPVQIRPLREYFTLIYRPCTATGKLIPIPLRIEAAVLKDFGKDVGTIGFLEDMRPLQPYSASRAQRPAENRRGEDA